MAILASLQDLLAGLHALLEVVHTEILETGTSDGGVVINSVIEGINLNVSLSGGRKSTLGTLASSTETTEGTLVLRHVLAVTTLEVGQEIVNHAVVKILSTQVSVSGGGLDLKDSLLNSKKRNIKGSTTKIENENILLFSLLVKTVGNGSGSWLVDDTEHVEAGDGTGILGSLTLRVIEVSRHSNDGVLKSYARRIDWQT